MAVCAATIAYAIVGDDMIFPNSRARKGGKKREKVKGEYGRF